MRHPSTAYRLPGIFFRVRFSKVHHPLSLPYASLKITEGTVSQRRFAKTPSSRLRNATQQRLYKHFRQRAQHKLRGARFIRIHFAGPHLKYKYGLSIEDTADHYFCCRMPLSLLTLETYNFPRHCFLLFLILQYLSLSFLQFAIRNKLFQRIISANCLSEARRHPMALRNFRQLRFGQSSDDREDIA